VTRLNSIEETYRKAKGQIDDVRTRAGPSAEAEREHTRALRTLWHDTATSRTTQEWSFAIYREAVGAHRTLQTIRSWVALGVIVLLVAVALAACSGMSGLGWI